MHDDLVMQLSLLLESEHGYLGKKIKDYVSNWENDDNLKIPFELIDKTFKNREIDYIYFGNEFCEYKIPTRDQLKAMICLCEQESIKLALVTPVVTEYGIKKISELFDYLVSQKIKIDIVINDVGVLELLMEKSVEGNPILGRIFDKTSHDSRASLSEFESYYGENGKRFAMSPGIISKYSMEIFKRFGVERYEFDLPKIGLNISDDCKKSLYWPFSYLTTGRVCLFRSLSLDGKKKFLVGDEACSKCCLKYEVVKRKPINGYDNARDKKDLFLFQKGNTVFYINTGNVQILNMFDRVILQV